MVANETDISANLTTREETVPADVSDSASGSVLVLASDAGRASLVISGLGDVPTRIELGTEPAWALTPSLIQGASLIILAAPRIDLSLLADILALPAASSVPSIVFVDRSTRDETLEALRLGISAFIVDGLDPERVPAIVDVATGRHALTASLQEQLRKSRDDLAARKTIERAKGLLMEKSGLSEQDVYNSMRRLAMSQGKPLKEVAEAILSVFALFP